jgi:hypothetical protein
LDKDEIFAKGMARLQLSKNSFFSEDHLTVYFDILGDLEYIDEVFNTAMRRTYFKGLPAASELLDIHQEIVIRKKQEEIKRIEAATPKLLPRHFCNKENADKELSNLALILDLKSVTGLKHNEANEVIDKNKDLIPKDYHKNRNVESISNIFKGLLRSVT